MNTELPVHTVFLSLGTNLGDRNAQLQSAISQIEERIGTIESSSAIYETPPWGFQSKHMFLNMAVKVYTRLLPRQVLFICQAIERESGRKIKSSLQYQDRVIDIDIIFYDDLTLDTPELKLPHPFYKEREFVLRPLADIL